VKGGPMAIAVSWLGVALLPGCDTWWQVDVQTHIPPETQAAVQPYPQQLLVRWNFRGDSFWHVTRHAVLCTPVTTALDVTTELAGALGKCGPTIDLVAWLAPADPAANLPCGPRTEAEVLGYCTSPDGSCAPGAGQPSTTGAAFTAGGCHHQDAVAVELLPP
jgi:hypothetical protein